MNATKLRVIQGGKNDSYKPKYIESGVNISDSRYIPPGAIVNTQTVANSLPCITSVRRFK